MTTLQANGYISNAARTEGEAKTFLEDMRQFLEDLFGTDSTEPTISQSVINSGMRVGQRAAPSLTNALQYGKVDRFQGRGNATTVSAGTLTQAADSFALGASGQLLHFSGLTMSGGTLEVETVYRMEGADAEAFANKNASISAKVRHGVGSAVDWAIIVEKPTALDNFAAVSNVSTGADTSVSDVTNTTLTEEDVAMGDVSNGIQIRIVAKSGAVTTKNFYLTEVTLNLGDKAVPVLPVPFAADVAACQRYFEKSYPLATDPASATSAGGIGFLWNGGADQDDCTRHFAVNKRATPTIVWYSVVTGTSARIRDTTAGADRTVTGTLDEGETMTGIPQTTGQVGANRARAQWTAESEL